MFISVYKCDINNPAVCRALMDRDTMHREVQKMFDAARHEYNTLYRVEKGYLTVKSDIQPKNSGIFNKLGSYDMGERIKSWENGDEFTFQIFTAPNRSGHGKHHYIKNVEERTEWIKRQFSKHGAEVLAITETDKLNYLLSGKENRKTGGNTYCTSWNYYGRLVITDISLFLEMYDKGIGLQRAYGNGLLVLS